MSHGADTATPGSLSQRDQVIQRRAYQKWEAKRCLSGTALKDWLGAEAELDAELGLERWSDCAELGCRQSSSLAGKAGK
jgi:hypothetical protein